MRLVIIAAWFSILTSTAFADTPGVSDLWAKVKAASLERSPEIRSAEAQAKQRSAQTYTAFARWLPRVDATLSQSRSKDYSFVTSGALGSAGSSFTPTEIGLNRWQLAASLPLYKRSVHLNARLALAESEQADLSLLQRTSEIDWRLRQLLCDAMLASYRESATLANIESARTTLAEAKVRFELGSRTRVDVLRAESTLLNLDSKLLTERERRETAVGELTKYTGAKREELKAWGLDAFWALDAEKQREQIERFTSVEIIWPSVEPWVGAEEKKVEERIVQASAQYRQIQSNTVSAEVAAEQLLTAEWPELNVTGSLNEQGQNWSDAFRRDYMSYSVSVALSVPVFTSGALVSASLERARARESADWKRVADTAALKNDIENQQHRIQALRKSLESQRVAYARAEELSRLSAESYRLGKASLLEVQTAQSEYLDARSALVENEINLSIQMRKFAWHLGIELPAQSL